MNPLYELMFNPQYVNEDYIKQVKYQHFQAEQQVEIAKAVKAIHDYCDAARKIAPEFQSEAFYQCAIAVLQEMSKG